MPPGARASRPHAVPLVVAELPRGFAGSHYVGSNRSGQAEGEPWRRSRLIQVGEMAEAVPGLVRAGRPRSRGAIIVRAGRPRSRGGGIFVQEALKQIHLSSGLFVFIRGPSWFVFISCRLFRLFFDSSDLDEGGRRKEMLTVARKPAARPARLGRCPQRAESPPGFTLMELLVSFSLIGLVAVFIHLGYSIGLGAREKAEASLEAYQAAQASLDVLSRQIASMVPYVSSQEHEERPVPVLLFRASPQSLGFVTTWSAASGFAGGLRFVQVFTADADSSADPDSSAAPNPAPAGRRLPAERTAAAPRGRAAGPRHPAYRQNRGQPLPGRAGSAAGRPPLPHPGPGPGFGGLPQAGPAARGELPARLPDRSAPFQAPLAARRPAPTAGRNPAQPALERPGSLGLPRTLSWPCPSGATEGWGCVFKLS